MKIYKKKVLCKLTFLIVFQNFFSFPSLAAKFDYFEGQQESIYSPANTPLPQWDTVSPDFFTGVGKKDNQIDYQSIVTLIEKKQYEKARKKITSLLKQFPKDPQLYNLQALLDSMKGNNNAAKKNYLQAIKLDTNNSLAYLSLAKLAIEDDQLDKAKEYATKAQTINAKYPGTYLLLAHIAFKQSDKQEAEQVLLGGYKKVQGNIDAEAQLIAVLGKYYVLDKQPKKVLLLTQELVKRYPESNKALSLLASAQVVNKKKSLAEQTLLKIIKQDANDANHRIVLAKLISQQSNREKEVLKLLDEAIAIDPASPQALILKTTYLTELKRYQQALDNADKLDTLFPALTIGKQLRGDIYLADKKFDQALQSYQLVYQKKSSIKLLLAITNLMITMDKKNDAIELLKQELEKYDNNQVINLKLASIFQQQADYKKAEKHYNAVLAKQPDNVIALNNLAWIYAQQNNPEAIRFAKKAYEIAPESAAIADTYGYILTQQTGKVEEGLKILQEAAKIEPQEGDIQFHLAKAYSLSGEKQKAIAILETLNKQHKIFLEKENASKLLIKLKAE